MICTFICYLNCSETTDQDKMRYTYQQKSKVSDHVFLFLFCTHVQLSRILSLLPSESLSSLNPSYVEPKTLCLHMVLLLEYLQIPHICSLIFSFYSSWYALWWKIKTVNSKNRMGQQILRANNYHNLKLKEEIL